MAIGQTNGILRHVRRAALLRDGGGMTDGQLLECFLAGREEAAFEVLVRRHGPMVLGVCRRVLHNIHDAEDAFQATFLVLVRKAASLLPREVLGNWLYGVAYHTALKARAATMKRRTREAQVKARSRCETLTEDTYQDWLPVLDQELSRLPDKYREAVVLCDLEGKTRREAAQQLGIPEGTLSGRLTTAHRKLAQRLAGHGVTLSAGAVASVLSQNAAWAGVPLPLIASTSKAAALLATGKTAAGVVSVQVAALTESVMKAMLLAKLKATAAVLFVIGVVTLGGGALAHRPPADTRVAPPAVAADIPVTPLVADQEPVREEAQAPRERRQQGPPITGTLQSVDAEKKTVTLRISNRQTGSVVKTLAVAADTVILRDGNPGRLSDLKPGGRLTVKSSPDQQTAVSISETGRTIVGQLKSVDAVQNTVTITVSGGRDPVKKDVTYELVKDGKVTAGAREAEVVSLKDLISGSTVQLTFSVDDETKLIRIHHPTRNR